MAASILSMNLSGRFRVGGEARCLGQAVLQRLLRGTDLLFGQQAQFSPCLPGNYRMVGSPSAFIIYNCQLYSVAELRHSHCPVHDIWNDLPPSNWTVSRVFFEQVGQEVLAVSWFTDDTIQSKRKREAIVKRLLHLARDLSSSFGLPVLIGGSFHLSVEDVNLLIRESGFDGSFRCYGYWLDSMRRSIRASSLFIGATPHIELSSVRPRSLAGNVCLGFKNDTWRNPEDSFYYDPLSAKVTIAVSCQSLQKTFVDGGTLTTIPSPPPEPEEDTSKRRRGTRPRANFDVIRTTIDNYEPKTVARKTISNFAEELDGGSSFPLVSNTSRETGDASSAASRRHPGGGSFVPQDRGQALRSIQSATKRSSSKTTTSESDEMKELREILTRLKVGREVQIGVPDATHGVYRVRDNFPYVERGSGSDGFAFYDRGMEVVLEDMEGLSSGQFSRKLSTISESGESSCSSVVQYNGSLEEEVPDKRDSNWLEMDYALDNSRHMNLWKDGKRVVSTVSVEEFTDGSLGRPDGGSSSSTGLPSKQSSQDERIVEGSSDVDQDDKPIFRFSLWNESMEQKSLMKVTEEERVQESFNSKEFNFPEAVQHNYVSINSDPSSDLYEEERLESNLACRLM